MKKGFTLLETVVALIVIAVVSVTASHVIQTLALYEEEESVRIQTQERVRNLGLILANTLENSPIGSLGVWEGGKCSSPSTLDLKNGVIFAPLDDDRARGFFTHYDENGSSDDANDFIAFNERIRSLTQGKSSLGDALVLDPMGQQGCQAFTTTLSPRIESFTIHGLQTSPPLSHPLYMIVSRLSLVKLNPLGEIEIYPSFRPWKSTDLGERIVLEKGISRGEIRLLGGGGIELYVCSMTQGSRQQEICSTQRIKSVF